ncbi:hypothetical protein GLOIN_2v1766585 [Rhizophagus irregularis DAOM 181602=DAOM 197198]|nr:hypothetical protein GLOIN_2v1766585 [Rhizophagus irregularis DAOM 181602=DAOM 197198]
MRILFAQLCKLYTVFLVVNATILVLGAPLNNGTSMIPLTPLQKRLTIPVCPDHHPIYVESECESMYSILITCNTGTNPPDTDFISYPCSENIVTAYGAAQKLSLLSDPGYAEFLDIEPL